MNAALPPSRIAFSATVAELLRRSGLRVAITGAGGWLGQATLECLENALGAEFPMRVHAFGSYARTMNTRSGCTLEIKPLGDLRTLRRKPTLLLHYAFLTKDKVAETSLENYYAESRRITDLVVDAIPRIGATKVLFPSSGAVYGLPTNPDRMPRPDPKLNPYGTQKFEDESRFAQVCAADKTRLAIPRIFSLSGPFINKHDAYVLAAIINAALESRPVQLRVRKRVYRTYQGIRDLLDVAVAWLVSSDIRNRSVFDTGGEPIEVGDLARRVLAALRRTDLIITRPDPDGSSDDRYCGDEAAFSQFSQSVGIIPAKLDQQILETAAYLAEQRK